jgi:hypothetical protein
LGDFLHTFRSVGFLRDFELNMIPLPIVIGNMPNAPSAYSSAYAAERQKDKE